MGWPCPFDSGQFRVTVPSLFAVAVTLAGGSGTSRVGVTGGADTRWPAPSALTAYTENL
jgi:hypothetical protein